MNIGVNFAFFEDKINFGVGLFSIQLLYGMLSEDKHNKYIIFVTDIREFPNICKCCYFSHFVPPSLLIDFVNHLIVFLVFQFVY